MSPEVREAAGRHRDLVEQLRGLRSTRRNLGSIRVQYGVPAYLDAPVLWHDRTAMITGTSGPHLLIVLDDGVEPGPIHPTDPALTYLVDDLADAGAEGAELEEPVRIQAFGILHRFLALAGGGVASW